MVFISYAHESPAHSRTVLALAERLEREHIAVSTDHPHLTAPPPEGWRAWLAEQVKQAAIVLVVCSPKVKERFDRVGESTTTGIYEGTVVTRAHFEEAKQRTLFFPILTDEGRSEDVPEPLVEWHHDLRFPSRTQQVLRLITEAMRTGGGQAHAGQVCATALRNTPTLDPSVRTLQPVAPSRLSWRTALSVFAALTVFGLAMYQGSRETRATRLLAHAQSALTRGDRGAARRPLSLARSLTVMERKIDEDLMTLQAYDAFQSHLQPQKLYADLQPVLRRTPGHVHALVAKAHGLAWEGKSDQARTTYERALKQQPGHLDAELGLMLMQYRRGALEQVQSTLERSSATQPNNPRVLYHRADLNYLQHDFRQAKSVFLRAIRHDPSYLPSYLGLAATERRLGDYEQALGTLLSAEADFKTGVERGINRGTWPVRLPSAAQTSPDTPAVVELLTPARKYYHFRLSVALSACLTGDEQEFADAQQRLKAATQAPGFEPTDAHGAERLIRAELLDMHAQNPDGARSYGHCLRQLDIPDLEQHETAVAPE